MTAVDLLVANGAVPETRRPQVVKRWRHDTNHRLGGGLRRHVGVTFKAHVPHFLARQHSRVSGAMNFMTTGTALQSHRRVLECERTPLVGVALKTTWLIGREGPNLPEEKAAMRIVAVRARHCSLHKPVSVRALKLAPGAEMAGGTLLIDRSCFPHHQALRFRFMHSVAAQATDAVASMPALDPPYMSGLIQVAGKAGFISLRSSELRGVAYVLSRSGLDVFARRTVARLARMRCPSALLIHVYYGMRIFLKCGVDILMTCLAGLGSHVLRLLRFGGDRSDPQTKKSNECPNTEHGLCRPRMSSPGHDKPCSSLQLNSYWPVHVLRPERWHGNRCMTR